MRVTIFVAFFLLFLLASSASHEDGLRGDSPGHEDVIRAVQFPSFSSFLAFLQMLFGRVAAVVLSLPIALIQFLLSLLSSFWNFVLGIFLSVSAPFTTTTTTTTTTLLPTTAMTTLAASTSSVFFSTVMTTSTPVTSGSAGTSMTSLSTVPTVPTSTTTSIPTTSTETLSQTTRTTSTKMSTTTYTSTSTATTTTTTPPEPKTVFVTRDRFNGNLGGLEGADAKCSDAAQAVNLTGRFLAWLSNSTESPDTRFTRSLGPYLLVDGTTFADNYNALVSGNPLVNLDLRENNGTVGGSILNKLVWTGTDTTGRPFGNNCSGWESSMGSLFGQVSRTDDWTNSGTSSCNARCRLFCFEQ